MERTQIVVPCYNEADRLDCEAFAHFHDVDRRFRFLFVNDGSSDDTSDILDDMHCRDPRAFEVLHLERNRGKAEAVRRGMMHAFSEPVGAVGFWDADLATPLEELPRFQDVLDRRPDVAIVVGTRLPLLGRRIERRWIRQTLGNVFCRFASRVLGVPIRDTQCGAKLFRVSPAMRDLLAEPFASRWIFDVELLMRWLVACHEDGETDPHARLYELPLEHWREVKGSRLKAGDFFRAAGELWRIHRKYASLLRTARSTAESPAIKQDKLPTRPSPRPAPRRRSVKLDV